MKANKRYSPEVREQTVRMVFEHQHEHESQWATIESIAAKIGCTAKTLRRWMRQSEIAQVNAVEACRRAPSDLFRQPVSTRAHVC